MDEEVAREEADADFEKKREEQRQRDQEKTEKNRKRREKNKARKGGKEEEGKGKDEVTMEVVEGGGVVSKLVEKRPHPLKQQQGLQDKGDDQFVARVEEVGVTIHDDD